jgi:hypothetical protein
MTKKDRKTVESALIAIGRLKYLSEDTKKMRHRAIINVFEMILDIPVVVGNDNIEEGLIDYVVVHPFGTYQSPDMIVNFGKETTEVNIKSSKNGAFTWDGHIINRDALYIFMGQDSSEGVNGTTYAMGYDIITGYEQNAIETAEKLKIGFLENIKGLFPKTSDFEITNIKYAVKSKNKPLSDSRRSIRESIARSNFLG